MNTATKVHVDKNDSKAEMESLGIRLGELQRACLDRKIPVIILLSGPSASGKGRVVGQLVQSLDPRGFALHTASSTAGDSEMYPFFARFWKELPAQGAIGIFVDNWYRSLFHNVSGFASAEEQADWVNRINLFERQLTDSGHQILKFYLHVSKEEQKKRLKKLESNSNNSWRVTEQDWKMYESFDSRVECASGVLSSTHNEMARWTVLPADSGRYAALMMTRTIVEALQGAIDSEQTVRPPSPKPPNSSAKHVLRLADIDLSKTLERKKYSKDLKRLRRQLQDIHSIIYRKRIPVVIAYEGWDAAGKGGNIRRLVGGLDPRGYRVIPIAAPVGEEKSHHYLWRFWNHVPRSGHIAIFDRTWYGRVLVEKIEGFCTPEECERAYSEIVEMEQEWTRSGVLVMKFWLHLSKDEQLRRFEERQQTPHKQWKITDEDLRNREKWDQYEKAVDCMLARTNSKYAPWTVVESDSKPFARVKVLDTVVERFQERL